MRRFPAFQSKTLTSLHGKTTKAKLRLTDLGKSCAVSAGRKCGCVNQPKVVIIYALKSVRVRDRRIEQGMANDDLQRLPVRTGEERAYLFEMIAELAALASGRGEKAVAVMLTAIVRAYQ
jgi:hypothetical protein